MASGYEKHACGAEPGVSWGDPRPFDNALSGAVAILLFVLIWAPTLWWLTSMMIGLLSG